MRRCTGPRRWGEIGCRWARVEGAWVDARGHETANDEMGRGIALRMGAGRGASAQAPAKKPITHETLWMMKRVGAPAVSPDGKWAVYSVLEPAYEPKDAVSDLWLVATDGSTPARRISHTKEAKDDVDWSPDSTRIAFATKREGDEVAQIYILDLSPGGGEARRLTNLSTGASRPKWRPDGEAILFQSRVYPGALDDEANKKIVAEHKARKYNVRAYDHFPVRYWNEWLDERLPTLLVQSIDSRLGEGYSVADGARFDERLLRGRDRHERHARAALEPGRPRDSVRCDDRALERGVRARAATSVSHARDGRRAEAGEPDARRVRGAALQRRRQIAFLQIRTAATRKSTTSPGSTEYRGPAAARPRWSRAISTAMSRITPWPPTVSSCTCSWRTPARTTCMRSARAAASPCPRWRRRAADTPRSRFRRRARSRCSSPPTAARYPRRRSCAST